MMDSKKRLRKVWSVNSLYSARSSMLMEAMMSAMVQMGASCRSIFPRRQVIALSNRIR